MSVEFLNSMIITIDGPAGSGKSTTASRLAGRLGIMYLDTGAMYRAVTLETLKRGVDPEDARETTKIAETIDLGFKKIGSAYTITLDGKGVEEEIRGAQVTQAVSPVSKHPGVRKAMVRLQRKIVTGRGAVVEGRDTGTVVFPYAHLKVFLIADMDSRVKRRREQLLSMGIEQDALAIRANIEKRDSMDSSRETSPLTRPPGSLLVDTSKITIEDQVGIIESHALEISKKLSGLILKGDRRGVRRTMRFFYRISHNAVRCFFRVIFGLRIYGQSNMRFGGGFIFASNHISYFDPPVVGCAINREVCFLAKKQLFSNRIFAWLIRSYNAIPVDREDVDRRIIKVLMAKLHGGDSILMFPEGTRSKNGKLRNLKEGLGFISIHTSAGIIPIYVNGTNEMFRCMLRKKRLIVSIGPPIFIPEFYSADKKKSDYSVLASMVYEEMRMLRDEPRA